MPEVAEAQPVPTYYPSSLTMDQAQPIVIERGTSVTGVELVLIDGVMAKVTGTLVDGAGQPVTRGGSIGVRPIIKDVAGGGFGMNGSGTKPDGTFELRLAPGEYELEGRANPNAGNGPSSPNTEQFGVVRLTISGDVSGLTIPLGAGARITGRIIFEGAAAMPAVPANQNGPGRLMFSAPSSDGQGCRSGRGEVAADWTFFVEGVFGTCVARFGGGFAPWVVKKITYEGRDLMDQPVAFAAAQQMRDVEVIMTDKRTELTLHVADEHGAPTREYAAIVFSTDKSRWTEGSRFLRTYTPPPEQMMTMMSSGMQSGMNFTTVVNGVAMNGGTIGGVVSGNNVPSRPSEGAQPATAPGGSTARKELISALPAGDYYVVALDDIDLDSTRDPEILQQLARGSTRVNLVEGVPADVNLRRFKLTDLTQQR
jgi:hypothetical protein